MVWYRLAGCNVAASVRLIKRRITKEEHTGWRGGKLRDDASKGGG